MTARQLRAGIARYRRDVVGELELVVAAGRQIVDHDVDILRQALHEHQRSRVHLRKLEAWLRAMTRKAARHV